MRKRIIASQREIARATATMGAASPLPEIDYNDPQISAVVVLLFEERNAPGIPPHRQREFREAFLKKELRLKNGQPAKRLDTTPTQHQSKPYGRGYHTLSFGLA